jgi:hypothetical protein
MVADGIVLPVVNQQAGAIPLIAGRLGDQRRGEVKLEVASEHGTGIHQKRIDKHWAIS